MGSCVNNSPESKAPFILLNEFANTVTGQPFAWGVTDCFTLALRAIDAMYGTDLEERFVNQWHDEASAAEYAQTFSVSDYFADLGECIELPFLRAGDVLEKEDEQGMPRVAVVVGRHVLASAPEHDVLLFPLRLLDKDKGWRAWRIVCRS